MKSLVIYDSQFGNTERIAQTIAEALRAFGPAQAVCIDAAHPASLQGVELLILGSPTQALRPTIPIQTFLQTISPALLNGTAIACYDTRLPGFIWKISAAPYMTKRLQKQGVMPLLPPESFLVKSTKEKGTALLSGEIERAISWAQRLHRRYEAQETHVAIH